MIIVDAGCSKDRTSLSSRSDFWVFYNHSKLLISKIKLYRTLSLDSLTKQAIIPQKHDKNTKHSKQLFIAAFVLDIITFHLIVSEIISNNKQENKTIRKYFYVPIRTHILYY